MAIEANTGSTFNLYTGIINGTVVAINPTKEELNALGIKAEKDPEYKATIQEKEYQKLKIYIQGSGKVIDNQGKEQTVSILKPIDYLISNREHIASTGSKRITNNYGNFTWAKDIETLQSNPNMTKWYPMEGIRYANEGEDLLVEQFLKNWLKVGKGHQCSIDNWTKLVNGDTTEIKDYIKNFKHMSVNVLLHVTETVKDGKTNYYNNIYNRYLTNGEVQSTEGWTSHFNESTTKINYQNSFKLQLFNPDGDTPNMGTPNSTMNAKELF